MMSINNTIEHATTNKIADTLKAANNNLDIFFMVFVFVC